MWTLGSRSKFEDVGSYLPREFLPQEFAEQLEEGLTNRALPTRQAAKPTGALRPSRSSELSPARFHLIRSRIRRIAARRDVASRSYRVLRFASGISEATS
jgi:hypothetical protein